MVLHRLTRAQELLAAEEKAEQVNEMKSAFPANMSHEIRTPLTSVIGFAEAIREEVETGDTTVPQFADLIEQGGHRLLETLGAVSSLSKLEAEEVGVLFEQQAVDQMEGPSRSTRNRAWAPASSCDSPGQAAGRGHVEWAHGPNGPPGRLRAEHRLYPKRTTSWTCSSAQST